MAQNYYVGSGHRPQAKVKLAGMPITATARAHNACAASRKTERGYCVFAKTGARYRSQQSTPATSNHGWPKTSESPSGPLQQETDT